VLPRGKREQNENHGNGSRGPDRRRFAGISYLESTVAESTKHEPKPKSMSSPVHSIADDWLTACEAAHYLKVKPRTLLLWTRQGKVKGFALSGTKRRVWRYRKNDLDAAFLEFPVLPSKTPSVRPAERMDQ